MEKVNDYFAAKVTLTRLTFTAFIVLAGFVGSLIA